MWDLVVKGGRIMDPSTDTDVVGDVGVFRGQVSSVGCDLDERDAAQLVDARGLLVLPGLVDIHTHIWGSSQSRVGLVGV